MDVEVLKHLHILGPRDRCTEVRILQPCSKNVRYTERNWALGCSRRWTKDIHIAREVHAYGIPTESSGICVTMFKIPLSRNFHVPNPGSQRVCTNGCGEKTRRLYFAYIRRSSLSLTAPSWATIVA